MRGIGMLDGGGRGLARGGGYEQRASERAKWCGCMDSRARVRAGAQLLTFFQRMALRRDFKETDCWEAGLEVGWVGGLPAYTFFTL